MNRVKTIFQKCIAVLRAKPVVGGLEISDSGIRFMQWSGSRWEMASTRLVPGTVVRGEVKNRKEFIDALKLLRFQILGGKKKGSRTRISVVVSLSSINIYTQVFNLPVIEGENLEKAVQLNIQMASPNGAAENYSGWQLVSPVQENMRLEILSAFLSKNVADDLAGAMHEAGFVPVVIESRALSLARVIKETEAKFDPKKSLIVVSVDASGLDVIVVRAGHLHFEYFNSWQDLQGDQRTIPLDVFRSLVLRSINQVLNFYGSHWSDPVSEVLVSAVGLKDEVVNVVKENFEIPVRELTPMISPPVGTEWFVALGGGLRGRMSRREDKDVSLLGIDAQGEFRREQALHFTDFWRTLMPVTIGILLVVFVGFFFFLMGIDKKLKTQAAFQIGGQEMQDINVLQTRAQEFNTFVRLLASANAAAVPKAPVLKNFFSIANSRGVSVNRIRIQSATAPVEFTGAAPSQESVRAFKGDISSSTFFRGVELPFTNVICGETQCSFSMTFSISPAKAD